jgi:hypothetical protein
MSSLRTPIVSPNPGYLWGLERGTNPPDEGKLEQS